MHKFEATFILTQAIQGITMENKQLLKAFKHI